MQILKKSIGSILFIALLCILLIIDISMRNNNIKQELVLLVPRTELNSGQYYSTTIETKHKILFAMQYNRELYVIVDDILLADGPTTLIAPGISEKYKPYIIELKNTITLSEYYNKYSWWINSHCADDMPIERR